MKNDDFWTKKEYLLFDLDGTLTDPKLGITTCVQYALKFFGIEEPNLDKLEPFIGPPLMDSFRQFYGFSEEDARKAVDKYRERFSEVGLFENEIYEGVPQMLKKLKSRGMHLGIASSKPTVFVERILEHFEIKGYFEVIVGSELDGTRAEKSEVVREALRRFFPDRRVETEKVYMIGDRKFDVEGARAFGVESVGVSYGYGGTRELMEAHADYVVRSVEELRRFLLRGYEDMEKDLTPFQKVWILLYHFVVFQAVRGLVYSGGVALLGSFGLGVGKNTEVLLSAAGFVAAALAIFKGTKSTVNRTLRDMYLNHLTWDPKITYVFLALASVGLSQGMSMLLSLTGLSAAESYAQVAEHQQGAFLPVMLLTFGIISPIAEEMLFRGVLYGYIRRFTNIRAAVVATAILFGLYHGNLPQAVYAASLGYLLAYAYEYFGSFRIPVLIHMGINLLTLLLGATGIYQTAFCSWPVCVILLGLGGLGVWLLARQKKVI